MGGINLREVVFKYPKSSFSVEVDGMNLDEGKLYIILGKNGSGKTTILKLCCGILKADTGSVMIFGNESKTMNLGQVGNDVAYLFQEPSKQLFATTVWDEMTFAAYFKGEDENLARDKAAALLKKFNLYHLIKRSTHKLSRGEKQRLAIATILMQDIKFLILDEPTTGLDRDNRAILYDVIETLLKDGTGIAIITHDNELVRRFPQGETINIENGAVVKEKEGFDSMTKEEL